MVKKRVTQKNEQEKFDRLRPPHHHKIYATNAFASHSTQDVRVDLCNEKLHDSESNRWGYVIEATIIFSPIGAKKLLIALKKSVESYERQYGEIDINNNEEVMKDF